MEFETFFGEHDSLEVNADGRDLVMIGAGIGNSIRKILHPVLDTMAVEVSPRRFRFPHVDIEVSIHNGRKSILLYETSIAL